METLYIPVTEPDQTVSFDSLPVIQLRHFPGAPGHDLPFVQGRVCAEEGRSLHLKLGSYEVGRPADSRMIVSFGSLTLTLAPGSGSLTLDSKPLVHAAVRITPMDGEDLQGEYWGAVIQLPLAVLHYVLPDLTLRRGERLPFAFSHNRTSTGYTACVSEEDSELALA